MTTSTTDHTISGTDRTADRTADRIAAADDPGREVAETELTRITEATRAAIASSPVQAQAVFRATATARGTVGSTIALGDYRITVDEPPALGGAGSAPNPVEYHLAAFLSCQIVTYRFYADRLGLEIEDITAEAEGDLDVRGFFAIDDTRAGFSEVRVRVHLTGPESAADYERLQEIVDAHCPVLDITRNATPVVTSLSVG